MLTAKSSIFAPSMYRDMQGNAPVEVDQILDDMVLRARRVDIETPLLEAAAVQRTIYQRRIMAAVDAASATHPN